MKTLILAILLLPIFALSYELSPSIKSNQLEMTLKDMPLPDSLQTEIQSGLTNRLILQVILKNEKQVIINRVTLFSVKYDLWDENYNVQISESNSIKQIPSIYKTKEAVFIKLKELKFSNIIEISKLDSKLTYTIFCEALLNPISK